MTIGILPNVNSVKMKSGCKFGDKCSFPHWKAEEQPKKKPKQGGDKKCSGNSERCATVGLRISGHRAAGILNDFTEGHKSLGTNSTSTIHKSCAASCKHPKNKRPSLNEIQVKVRHQRNPCPMKFEDRSQEETE